MKANRTASTGEPASPLTVVSVREALTRELRDEILSGARPPGDKVTEEDVARRYQVARPTARQVIQDLVFEGLLRRERNRSAQVPELTGDDVREIFAIRELIETMAIARLAERREVPDEMTRRVRLLEQVSAGEEEASQVDWAAVVEHDQTFHTVLVSTLGNRRLARMYASVQTENRLCLAQDRNAYASAAEVAQEHQALLDGIAEGSPERAVELLQTHLREAMKRVVVLAESGQGWRRAREAES